MKRPRTEVFLREDIQNTLNGIDKANKDLANNFPDDPGVAIFRKGFMAALSAIGQALGTRQVVGSKKKK